MDRNHFYAGPPAPVTCNTKIVKKWRVRSKATPFAHPMLYFYRHRLSETDKDRSKKKRMLSTKIAVLNFYETLYRFYTMMLKFNCTVRKAIIFLEGIHRFVRWPRCVFTPIAVSRLVDFAQSRPIAQRGSTKRGLRIPLRK